MLRDTQRELTRSTLLTTVSTTALAVFGLLLCPTPTAAQTTTSEKSAQVEEVVVVAQRREQRLQDVGISISAFNADTLASRQINRGEDLALLAPGLSAVQNSGSAVSLFTVRGVGQADYADHHEQPNAIYEDQVYVGSPIATGFPLIDIQRVEVLRGPQGTLFGRNATGGVIQFISKKPDAETDYGASISYAEFNTVRAQGFLNGAIGERAAARLAVSVSNADGSIKNTAGPDLQTDNVIAARLQFKFDFSDQTSLLLRGQVMRQRDTGGFYKAAPSYKDAKGVPQFLPANLDAYGTGPGRDFFGYRDTNTSPFTVEIDTIGYINKDVESLSATLDHDFNGISLTSVSNFTKARSRYLEDADGSPNFVATYESNTDAEQLSQELRLAGDLDKFNWVLGAYYYKNTGTYFTEFDLPTFFDLASTGAALSNAYSLDTQSWAIFGQGEYKLTDQFTFIAGLRYTGDEKTMNLTTRCRESATGACAGIFFVGARDGAGNLIPTAANLGKVNLNRNDEDWSGRLQLNYEPTDNLLFYVSANKGIKGGGFTVPLDGFLTLDRLSFAPEELLAYETGFKSTLAGGKVRLNGGAYYYDYLNLQTFQAVDLSSQVISRQANAYGGELELTARLAPDFDISAGIALNNFEVKGVITPTARGGENQEPILAPKVQLNWSANKSFQLSDDLELKFQYSGSYVGSRFFNNVNLPVTKDGSYQIHNATIAIASEANRWSLEVYGSNLFNEAYKVFAYDLSALGYSNLRFGPRRQIGLRLNWRI